MDNKIKNIPAVILAGGKSSRMKQDKALIPFEHYDTLAEYQYNKLSTMFKNVFISAKADKFGLFHNKQLILDASEIYSPMIALDSIFQNIDYQKIFIISVDIPFITQKSIVTIINESSNDTSYQIFLAKDKNGQRHPLCSVFDRSIVPAIQSCLTQNIHKINYLIDQCNHKELIFYDEMEFLNMNTLEEYQRAQQLFTIT